MKVIDLLNKIANGETPSKIIYLPYATNNEYAGKYSYEQGDYLKDGWSNMWLFKDHLKAKLNDEVEIIEEEKEIKMCDVLEHCVDFSKNENVLLNNQLRLQNKINELIDAVTELRKEK